MNRRSVDDTAKRVAVLTDELRKAETQKARAEGKRDQLLERLKNEFGLTDIDKAKTKLEKLMDNEEALVKKEEELLNRAEEIVYGS